ncbi:MAG: NAD(P)/FAD-dependent oxidoreductase [Hyphomicrobium sp.]
MTEPVETFDAVILGAGAAGLMCALTAGQRGRKVLLFEHTDKPGAKILISGGGRCNFTNLGTVPERFLSDNPRFCISALSRYTPSDFIALVRRHGIAFHEKTLGQLFCDGSARAIVAMLVAECRAGGVDLRLGQSISGVTRTDQFHVETQAGIVSAPSLVLATGGLSIPKMGATGFSYDLARRFGLRVTATRPGLVGLKAVADAVVFDAGLAGVSIDAVATFEKYRFRESLLFTHRGLSGPAILQISSYWRPGGTIVLDLLPERAAAAHFAERRRSRPKAAAHTVLAEIMPARLAQALTAAHLPQGELGQMPGKALSDFAARLNGWPYRPEGTEGYAKAEVTVGGIDTRDLSSKTLQARAVPGLYCIGEAVDVTGWLGGYNFQWAWASGWSAGQAV